MGKSSINGPFSMAMLNNQRISNIEIIYGSYYYLMIISIIICSIIICCLFTYSLIHIYIYITWELDLQEDLWALLIQVFKGFNECLWNLGSSPSTEAPQISHCCIGAVPGWGREPLLLMGVLGQVFTGYGEGHWWSWYINWFQLNTWVNVESHVCTLRAKIHQNPWSRAAWQTAADATNCDWLWILKWSSCFWTAVRG